MGIDLDSKLVETATKVTTTRNEYGDVVYGATTSRSCLYRNISMLERQQNRELVNIDGILWFKADESIELGDVYYHPDEGYLRIEQIVKAKRLVADNALKFIKTLVSKQRQIS